MNDQINFDIYQSPFSWRYASEEMRRIFSESKRRKTWRKVWTTLARAQHKTGLITKQELADIEKNASKIDIKKSLKIEKEIYHDVMAEIKTFASQAKIGGGKIHLGATSTDITDNADIIIFSQALNVIEKRLIDLLNSFVQKIQKYENLVCMGYTHLQPAEPTTIGYRFALYAQDLLSDLTTLRFVIQNLKAKGVRGAVGTSASYFGLFNKDQIKTEKFSDDFAAQLGLKPATVTAQTYPRKTDFHIIFALASIAQSVYKFAFDLRIMQSPNFGEWSEPRGEKRVGSSAMPFKRNPDKCEKICSLSRYIASLINVAWENSANSLLERTLDDSANRRVFIPEAFLAADEILAVTNKLVGGIVIFEENVKRNLQKFGPFAGTESLMMEAVKNGANRQDLHERIREISMDAWEKVNTESTNPLVNLIKSDKMISAYIKKEKIEDLLNPSLHIGLAPNYCQKLIKEIKLEINK